MELGASFVHTPKTMRSSSEYLPGTSGHVLPRILRQKLRNFPPPTVPEGFAIPAGADVDDGGPADVEPHSLTSHRRTTPSRIDQLEEVIHKSTQALLGIHKQIQRGEEVYYEDTYGFGGLFTGFDSVLDARGVGEGGGGNMLRRMPGDARWFSLPLHVHPPIPPPVITDQVPVTVEAAVAASSSYAINATARAKSDCDTLPVTSSEKNVISPSKKESETGVKPRGDEDEHKPQVASVPDDDDGGGDEDDDAPGEDEAEAAPVSVSEPRATRSKRKSMTPVPTRRTKRRKR
jgi:hypothetical protein